MARQQQTDSDKKEGKHNVTFIAVNDHIKPQICNQKEKREVYQSGKKIQGTEPDVNTLASVVDVITVYMPMKRIKVSEGLTFIFTMLYLEDVEK